MNSGRGSIRRKPSIYAAVTRSDHLLDYTIQITSNHKRFPKHLRYQLSDKLVTLASKVSAKLRSAAQLRPNTLKATKKIGKYLDKAMDKLSEYESLFILAKRYCNPGNVTYWSSVYSGLQSSILEWITYNNACARKIRYKESKNETQSERSGDSSTRTIDAYMTIESQLSRLEFLEYTGFHADNPKLSIQEIYG